MWNHRDSLLIEREKKFRVELAEAEKTKRHLEQSLQETTIDAHTLVNHYADQIDLKNDALCEAEKRLASLEADANLRLHQKLNETKRVHIASIQCLRKEIDSLQHTRFENERLSKSLQSLEEKLHLMQQEHEIELRKKDEDVAAQKLQMEERISHVQNYCERFSKEDELVILFRTMVTDNKNMALQLERSLKQLDILSREKESLLALVHVCQREVEIYKQQNELSIKQIAALKQQSRRLDE